MTAAERFLGRVNHDGPTPDECPNLGPCWTWALTHDRYGYGLFKVGGKTVKAHRFAYELLVGPIPSGLTIDHLCRVRGCVNPAHLEPVTNVENLRRGLWGDRLRDQATKTHCKRGHEFTPENTHIGTKGERRCRACWRWHYHNRRHPVAA